MPKTKKPLDQEKIETQAAKNTVRAEIQPANTSENLVTENMQTTSTENSHITLKYGLIIILAIFIVLFGLFAFNDFKLSPMAKETKPSDQSEAVLDENKEPNIMYFEALLKNVKVGENLSLPLRANSFSTNVNAVQATVTYPADLLELVAIDSSRTAYKMSIIEQTEAGKITIAKAQIGGVAGDQLIANLNFKTKAAGQASLKFVNTTALMSSKTNKNILPTVNHLGSVQVKIVE